MAALMPLFRLPLIVCFKTTANEGPGDIAPKQQIPTIVSQEVSVIMNSQLLKWLRSLFHFNEVGKFQPYQTSALNMHLGV
jgi:hypothetical protein